MSRLYVSIYNNNFLYLNVLLKHYAYLIYKLAYRLLMKQQDFRGLNISLNAQDGYNIRLCKAKSYCTSQFIESTYNKCSLQF